ncbi:MAG TPA: hypothetical protein VLA59_10385 [Patescibacteria group bacterium]|nr:hypothetical protein [Patescibacteria group bacterium]
MNQTSRSVGATISVILLGVTAAGAAAFGLFAPVIALGAAELLGGTLGATAKAAMVVVGIISLLFAAAAAVAAFMIHARRPAGAVIGLVVGAILIVGPVVAAASGGWHPALAASVALGAGLIGSVAVALPAGARP